MNSVLLLLILLLSWTVGQPEPGNLDDDDEDTPTPRSGVPRVRLIRNRYVNPQMGGIRPTTSARVQASDVNAALDILTALDDAALPDQSADLSVSLGPQDNGKPLQIKYKIHRYPRSITLRIKYIYKINLHVKLYYNRLVDVLQIKYIHQMYTSPTKRCKSSVTQSHIILTRD